MNRYYIRKIKKIKEEMIEGKEDPMISFKKNVKSPINKLEIKEINMSDLRKIYTKIKK